MITFTLIYFRQLGVYITFIMGMILKSLNLAPANRRCVIELLYIEPEKKRSLNLL